MLRSIIWWISKLSQGITVNKQGRSDSPASNLLAEAVSTKSPNTAKVTGSDLIDTPPPSYEDVCLGPVGAGIGAVTDAQLIPQHSKNLKTVDGVIRGVDDELRRYNVPDANCVSSGIRQLCCFASCRVSDNYRGCSNVMAEERRKTNHREIHKLFSFVMKPITPECLVEVINMTANAFEGVAEQVMAERKYNNHWQVRGEFHFMRSSIYRAAVRVRAQLAVEETFPRSLLADLVFVARSYDSAANSCVRAARCCIR